MSFQPYSPPTLRPLLALCLLAACVARPKGDTDSGATEGTNSDGTSLGESTGPGAPTTGGTIDPPAPTTASPATSEPAPSTTGGPEPDTTSNGTSPFLPAPDFGTHLECDTWAEDCPQGQKCMPWASDGGGTWNATKCVDIVPDPDGVGEPCTAVDSQFSGEDTCDKHMLCWDVGPDLAGTCVAMCIGTPDSPGCEDPLASCKLSGDGVINLCLSDCDPLLQDCPDGDTCVPAPGDDGKFVCVLDNSQGGGQVFAPCQFVDECAPGLFCADSQLPGECDPQVMGCCLAFCDLGRDDCPGQGLVCIPYFAEGQAPPGHEDLGACRPPMP